MNPDKNEFEKLQDMARQNAFREHFYGNKPKSEVPIFTMNELITLRGYIFKVAKIKPNMLSLRPVRKADV